MNIFLKKANLQDCAVIHEMQVIAFKPLLDKYKDFDTNPGAETIEQIQQRMQYPSLTHYFIQLQSKKQAYWRRKEHKVRNGFSLLCKISIFYFRYIY